MGKTAMGKTLLLFGLLTVIIITGCSKDNVVGPVSTQDGDGKMLLKIDKTNTPKNVATVTAYLTRTNYDTLKGFLNLKSDTSADMTFQNIPVGTWHLKIDAKDQSGSVTYTGETDVTIVESMTMQVSLTLQPVSGSVGGVYILVNWGSATSYTWTDYSGNPILSTTNTTSDAYGVVQPMVLIEDNTFKMWYENVGASGTGNVGYAVSSDGLSWTRASSTPVLTHGASGTWDSYAVGPGAVTKIDGVYMMYYGGTDGVHSQTGLATSTDGINWTKRVKPVLYASDGWDATAGAQDVIKIGNTYYMYYVGKKYSTYAIGLATSTDGINWTKYSGNPILSADQPWEGSGVYVPTIIYDNNQYIMVFANVNDANTAFGIATSTDGIHWTKDGSNPFFTYKNTYNQWVNYIQYPCIRKYNNEWRVYYSGYNSVSNQRTIALLRKAF